MYATSSTVMYISNPGGQVTTLVLHTGSGSGADRWNRFLSSVSFGPALSGSDSARNASIVAKWWRERYPGPATTAMGVARKPIAIRL
jgi:hypothetical protein